MFKDEVLIHVSSGSGGNGCISFRREKFIPKGGPNGGDGGKGGDVVFVVDSGTFGLGEFHNNQKFRAKNGQPGMGNNRTGKNGEDLVLMVPEGTIIRDAERGNVLKDLSDSRKPFVFLEGGRGGKGNARMASAIEQTPRRAEDGKPGMARSIVLELKMIADVGIIGLPNAGKSTLLSRISRATPQIADYPFTTLIPQLGVVEVDYRRLVFADIPGLIEGAHLGQGLGDRFLKHVERTRILLHLIDCGQGQELGFKEAYSIILKEISEYSPLLASKPQVVAVTKADLLYDPLDLDAISQELGCEVHLISAHSGKGLKRLIGTVMRTLDA